MLKSMVLDSLESVTWDMTLIIPDWAHLRIENSWIRVEHINSNVLNKGHFKYFLYDNNAAIPAGNNVTQVALYWGIMKEYFDILLIGNEYDFWKSTYLELDGNAWVSVKHVYETDALLAKWCLNEDKQCIEHGKSIIGGYLYRVANSLDLYCDINMYSENRGSNIVNLSGETIIDAFKLGHYSDYFDV